MALTEPQARAESDNAPDPFAPLGQEEQRQQHRADDEVWEPISPAPAPPPGPPSNAAKMWVYLDAQGRPLCARLRYNKEDGSKDRVMPYTYGRRVWTDRYGHRRDITGWHQKALPNPLPIFGLDQLVQRPDAPVLVVEGEKTADAASELFPDYVAVSVQAGSGAVTRNDWSALAGRNVTIWPDHDEPGVKFAEELVQQLRDLGAGLVSLVRLPRDLPQGWDVADPLPPLIGAGADLEVLRRWLSEAAPATASVKMPDGFRMTGKGLFFQPEARGESDVVPPAVFVAAPFEVVAETNDGAGHGWGLLIRWSDRDRRVHEWALPRRLIHSDGKELAGELEDMGLHCSVSAVTRLRQFIGSVRTSRRRRSVSRTGWHKTEAGHAFILPGGQTFGPAGDVVFQSTRGSTGREFATGGTLEGWQREVADYAVGNSRLALFLAAAFAGPLLEIAGEQSGGLHLVGSSQTGKSSSMRVAASVWGRGDEAAQVRQWRGTANGIEGIAAETSDTVLILDEMGQADAKEIGHIVYMLSNNSGKIRGAKLGGSRQATTWRSLFLSTGELTLGAKLAEAGRKIMAGQEVRLINVPADAGKGLGVFETLHGQASGQEMAEHIRAATRTHYGHASRLFLTRLAQDRSDRLEQLQAKIKQQRTAFLDEFVPPGAVGQISSVASRFALAAIAGELATEYGVLCWPPGEARRAAATCFRAWLRQRGHATSGEEIRAIEQVRAFIESHGESRFTVLGPAPTDRFGQPIESRTLNRVGFRERTTVDGVERWDYLILSEAWKNEVCKGIDAEAAARALADGGFLRRDRDARLTIKRSLPDHGRLRVYIIRGEILEADTADRA